MGHGLSTLLSVVLLVSSDACFPLLYSVCCRRRRRADAKYCKKGLLSTRACRSMRYVSSKADRSGAPVVCQSAIPSWCIHRRCEYKTKKVGTARLLPTVVPALGVSCVALVYASPESIRARLGATASMLESIFWAKSLQDFSNTPSLTMGRTVLTARSSFFQACRFRCVARRFIAA